MRMSRAILGPLVSAVLVLPGSGAMAVGPGITGPVGATVTEEGRGVTQSKGLIEADLGQGVVVQKIVVESGGTVGWRRAANAIVIMKKGVLTNYTSCTEKQTWQAGKTYLQDASVGNEVVGRAPGQERDSFLTRNEGSVPAEFLVIVAGIGSDQTAGSDAFTYGDAPDGSCPGVTAKTTRAELARGLAHATGLFSVYKDTNVVVQRIVLEPGYSTGWHRHPDDTLVLQLSGTLTNYLDCTEKEAWTAGNAYPHVASEHGNKHANLTKNEGSAPAETVFVFFNVPAAQQPNLVPISPANPPDGCPTQF